MQVIYSRNSTGFALPSSEMTSSRPRSKKLGTRSYYRAKLGGAGRLIMQFVEWCGQKAALALEVLPNHEYARSRFLRGSAIDEAHVPELAGDVETTPIKYLHPARATFAVRDKPLSFDDAQDEVLRRRPPLVLVGSAGSGQTALLLQMLRAQPGRVAYVTEPAWLAQSARGQYVAHGWDPGDQGADFVSYRQLLESIEGPPGRAVTFRDFVAFFERHRCFEEFRGVFAADPNGV